MKYILKSGLIIGMCMGTFFAMAQKPVASTGQSAPFQKSEDSLMSAVDSMNRVAVHGERIEYCHAFVKKLSHMLKEPNSFQYPFTELSKKIHIIYPEDKSFRIFNWPVEYAPAHFRYYGAIQKADGTIYPLVDKSETIEEKELQGLLDNKNWYGVEYYRVLTQKDATGKTLYFVFGVNHNNKNTSVKTIDVLSIQGNRVVFGGDYFERGNKRFLIEYQKGAQVSLNYDIEKGMVVYNALESEINQPQRKNTLVPTGQLDGLKWNNDQWQSVKNLVPILKLRDGQAPINGVMPSN